MKRCFLHAATGAVAAVLAIPAIAADVLPGATVAERALNGAKAYIEKNGGAENLKLTMLLSSLYRNSMPDFTPGVDPSSPGSRSRTFRSGTPTFRPR